MRLYLPEDVLLPLAAEHVGRILAAAAIAGTEVRSRADQEVTPDIVMICWAPATAHPNLFSLMQGAR